MAISVERGVYSAALGLFGGGVVILAPNQAWVGWALALAAAVLFIWGVRVRGRPWWQLRRRSGLPLYVESRSGRLPESVGHEGLVRTFSLIGMGDRPSTSFGTRPCSAGKRLDWETNPPPHAISITITNHGDVPLLNVFLKGELSVNECLTPAKGQTRSGDEIGKLDVVIPLDRIKPGDENAITVYVRNVSPYYGTLTLTEAEGAPIGEKPGKIAIATNWMGKHLSLFPDERFLK